MKTKKFTIGIVLFLFALFANFTVTQAQVTVWDDFDIDDGPLTDVNGISGSGWADAWTYVAPATSGVTVNNGAFDATDGGFGIARTLSAGIPLGSSTFYMSFIVKKDATGEFVLQGRRASDDLFRYAIGIKADGTIDAYAASGSVSGSSAAGVIENDKAYLVVAKYWYSGTGFMNIVSYAGGDAIPTDEPAAGSWDLEAAGGATGVNLDIVRLAFDAANVNLYDFKISDSWAGATDATVLVAPSGLEVLATSATTANLKWMNNAYNEVGSKIYMGGNEVGTVGPDLEQYELTGLTNQTEYTVGVSAYDGATETAATELTFTFEQDETPPTVVEVSPENNAVNVDETSDISITFSEAMNQASVLGALTVAPVLANPVYTWESETKLTISADDLASATQYTVTVGAAATDLSGNALTEYVTAFTVILKDVIPPTIIETTPANNATDVLITSSIAITFSEGMDKASVEGAITLAPEIANAAYRWNGDTMVTILGDKLAINTAYTLTIGTAAMDLKANALAAEEVVAFTTGSTDMVYDDFKISDGVLTSSNGSTGTGWDGPWVYETTGYIGGPVYAINEYMSGSGPIPLSGSGVGHITRWMNHKFSIPSTDFYMSFLAYRTADGSFDVLGGDNPSNARYRAGVGVSPEGALRFRKTTGKVETSTTTNQFEAGTTYLVVSKYTGNESAKVKIFKSGDATAEPADGEWDFETEMGSTGVKMEIIGLLYRSSAANIDEVKVGSSWDEVSGTTITDISEFPLIAPSRLDLEGSSTSTADLYWSDNCIVEEGFKIYLDETEVGTVGENENYFKLTGLTEDQTYIIKVSSYDGDTERFSDTISVTFKFDAENYVDTKIEIAKTDVAPVIDGAVDDAWANAFKNPVKRVSDEGELAPVDAADYQCTWSAMWDNDNLYFLFEVADEKLVFNDGSGTDIGQDDGFDMPMAVGENGEWTMNRLNLVAPAGSDTTLYIHEGMAAIKGAEKAYKFTENGYTIELSVVLRDYDENIGLFPEGTQFRIDVRYNDDDTEADRDGQYTWTDKNKDGWSWDNANSLGSVTLVGVIDNDAPTVTGTTPADDATGIALDSDITITFSEAMDKASVEAAISVVPTLTNATYTWDGDTEVTIAADDLTVSTAYTVTVATTAKDANGNGLAEEFSFSFSSGNEVGIEEINARVMSVYVSENGSLLNILNYEGMADIYSVSGRKILRVENTAEAVNIGHLTQGIYIVKTEAGAVKFVK
ncbi:MAG: hypothetical protein GY790_15610 [Bacteroidetes bacterium]|nr:hypothetical protein [Bacteroidota bacterium]